MIFTRLPLCLVATLVLVTAQASFSQQKLDVVYLNPSGKIVGTILDSTKEGSLRMELPSKEVIVVSLEKVKRIEEQSVIYGPPAVSQTLVPADGSPARETSWQIIPRSGSVLENASLDSLKGSMLFVGVDGMVNSLELASVRRLKLTRDSRFWSSGGNGALVGAACGTLIGLVSYQRPSKRGLVSFDLGPGGAAVGGALGGAAAGFLVGGLLGAFEGIDIIVEVPEGSPEAARTRLQEIFQNRYHP